MHGRSTRDGHAFKLAFLFCFLTLLLAIGCADPPAPTNRLVIIGVDGATFEVLDPLISAGKLPTLKKLRIEGASAILASERPMRSPALWTTVATGRPRSVHGIYDFVTGSTYWPPGRRAAERKLVTADMREVRALWNYATQAGSESLIVGWLNTWPAEKIDGVMVAPYVALDEDRQISIKGKIYRDDPRQAHPPGTFESLAGRILAAEDVTDEEVARLVDVPPEGSSLYEKIPTLERQLFAVRWSLASTKTNTNILVELLRRHPDARLAMTYFDGADTLGHRFWLLRQTLPEIRGRLKGHGLDPAMAEELRRRFGNAVDGYYQVIDESIGKILEAAGPDANVFVVSDHGWGTQPSDKTGAQHVPFDGVHTMRGILIAGGPDVVRGQFKPLTLYEVVPTVLNLLGLGIPAELEGRPAVELLEASFRAANPPVILAAHGGENAWRPEFADRPDDEIPFADREIERLRSLGYVE